MDDVHHVLHGQRLEVELVAGVVVGGDRLRVAVDHDHLVPRLAQGEAGVDTAVVEFNSLADPVGTAAEDHDRLLALMAAHRFAGVPPGGVVVGGLRLELSGAGVDRAEDRLQADGPAGGTHLRFGRTEQEGDLTVGVPELLRLPEERQIRLQARE